jgi:hypothetical protein
MTSSDTENVVFNPVTRKVTWSIDELPAGVGHQSLPREVSFQVAVVPSLAQLRDAIPILEDITMSGVDAFTDTVVKRSNRNVTTQLKNDPFFPEDEGRVRE